VISYNNVQSAKKKKKMADANVINDSHCNSHKPMKDITLYATSTCRNQPSFPKSLCFI